MKKRITLFIACALLLGLCPTVALAAERLPPAQTITMAEYLALEGLKSQANGVGCYIPYNNGSGTSGVASAAFVAVDESLAFILESLGGGTSYCAQLYMIDGGHLAAVAPYAEYAFGTGFLQTGLIVGETYLVKISSTSVSRTGANGRYYIAAFPSSGTPPFREYADLDMTTTTPEWWPGILQARYDVIFGADQKWSIDGMSAIKHADGTYEVLPKFSDLYPDWNLREICLINKSRDTVDTNVPNAAPKSRVFEGAVNLTADPAAFYRFEAPGGGLEIKAETLPGQTYSAALLNEDYSVVEAYCGSLALGQSLYCATVRYRYACIAASPDASGDAYFVVQTN